MLKSTIDEQLMNALRAKDSMTANTIRALKTAIKNREIDKGSELEEPEIIDVIAKEVKKRRDSIAAFESNDRADLAQDEKNEIAVLSQYLPEQITGEALREKVLAIVSGLSDDEKSNAGRMMGSVMKELKGVADGNEIQEIMKTLNA